MGKAFEKQIKTIEDQGKKQVKKEETKSIEDKSNNHLKAKIIFKELINKRKDLMKELYDSVDSNNLKFEYIEKKK